MASDIPLLEKDQIVVGKPLPFSVFGADGQLLLAVGKQVESERARQSLIKLGTHRSPSLGEESAGARAKYEPRSTHKPSPILAMAKDYVLNGVSRRLAVTMAPNETQEAYNTWVVGVTEQSMILTAPHRADGSLVAIVAGQTWLCRTFQLTSAFRFRTTVQKAAFEPYPHLYMEPPKQIERRKVRGHQRVNVFLHAHVDLPQATACAIIDLSVSGGRIATDETVKLERGQPVRLHLKLDLLELHFDLSLSAHVVGVFGATDPRHPQVSFYGLQFEKLSPQDSLVVHGFINQQLAVEMNGLWQLLASGERG